MPVTYDFNEGPSQSFGHFTGTGQLGIFDDNGVTFSLSANTVTGNAFAYLGGSAATPFPMFLSRGNGDVTGDGFPSRADRPVPKYLWHCCR